MSMRAPKQEAPATAGQSFVKGQFEGLGWGAVLNPEHDLGTDLWLMARDARRFDLGLLVGAQVKSGPSYFEEESHDAVDNVDGWWYREDNTRHFDYWTEHSVPHILVLHRLTDNQSFWVHVTRDRVVSTGKGAKIFVPASQLIDADHLAFLIETARSGRDVPQWEGSAWNIGKPIPAVARLRYALITPRLVAPHPNASWESPEPEAAIALLTQLRLDDLQHRFRGETAIDVEECRKSRDWAWRLYAAMYDWLVEGSEPLTFLLDEAPSSEARAAAAVLIANAQVEEGSIGKALAVLDAVIDHDDANPVDDAWLRAHKARCLRELGDPEPARAIALSLQQIRWTAPADPTAAAIAAAAAWLVFTIADWNEQTVGQLIQSSDTVATWWRSQLIAGGLGKHFDQDYRAWGQDTSFTFGGGDEAWLKLRSATLLSGYAADHSGWRHAASLLARRQLMRASADDHDALKSGVDLLRRCGEDKELQLAVQRLVNLGPTSVLQDVGRELDPEKSTRTSLLADLRFIKRAADVLLPEDAERLALWALATLENPDELRGRLKPTFLLEMELADVIGALMLGVSKATGRKIIEHVLALPILGDQSLAHEYAKVLRRIDDGLWTSDDLAALEARPDGDNFEFSNAAESVLATHQEGFRDSLLERIRRGDLDALQSYGDVKDLPRTAAHDLVSRLTARLREQVDLARQGAYGLGGPDDGAALVLVNARHSDVSNWAPIEELLAEPSSHPDHLVGGLHLLRRLKDQVPRDVLMRLKDSLIALSQRIPPSSESFHLMSRTDARGPAAVTNAMLFPESIDDASLRALLRGASSQREAAIEIITAREDAKDINLLAALSRDAEPNVRATAAEGLANWVTKGIATEEALEILRSLLTEPGTAIGVAVSRTLFDAKDEARRDRLIEELGSHPSSLVRARIARTSASHR